MKVYLDNSTLNRPFDDQSQPKIRLETAAVYLIFKLIEQKKIQFANSSVIEYENSKNPFLERKMWISAYLAGAEFYQKLTLQVQKRAVGLVKLKVKPIDALHLASAEIAKSEFLITCDNEILKKYKGRLKTFNPVDFIQFLESKKL